MSPTTPSATSTTTVVPSELRRLVRVHRTQIEQEAVLSAVNRGTYLSRNIAVFGRRRAIPASKTIAADRTGAGEPKPKSTVIQAGEAPDGFGKVILWDAADEAIAVMAFLNAADYLGVMISGVRRTDTIEFVNSDGLASFSEEDRNRGIGSFIGLIAAGASAVAGVFGAPWLVPVIQAGSKFAQDEFQEQKVKTKKRDPFGVNPDDGGVARQEGGVLVCMPGSGGAFYSGDEDHQDRWVKPGGNRDDNHIPRHIHDAVFLQRNMGSRASLTNGDIIILPWDVAFPDNFGFYRLDILLRRGPGSFPPVGAPTRGGPRRNNQ